MLSNLILITCLSLVSISESMIKTALIITWITVTFYRSKSFILRIQKEFTSIEHRKTVNIESKHQLCRSEGLVHCMHLLLWGPSIIWSVENDFKSFCDIVEPNVYSLFFMFSSLSLSPILISTNKCQSLSICFLGFMLHLIFLTILHWWPKIESYAGFSRFTSSTDWFSIFQYPLTLIN